MIGNKISDKTTSLGKTKSEEKEDEKQKIYIPPEKRQHIIDDLRLFWCHIKMEQHTTPNEVCKFITKKWVEVHD